MNADTSKAVRQIPVVAHAKEPQNHVYFMGTPSTVQKSAAHGVRAQVSAKALQRLVANSFTRICVTLMGANWVALGKLISSRALALHFVALGLGLNVTAKINLGVFGIEPFGFARNLCLTSPLLT